MRKRVGGLGILVALLVAFGVAPALPAAAQTGGCNLTGTVDGSATPPSATAGETIVFRAQGFRPGESISFFFTLPDGGVFGTAHPIDNGVNPDGTVGPIPFQIPQAFTQYPGTWAITFQGATSNHVSIIKFCVTSTAAPPATATAAPPAATATAVPPAATNTAAPPAATDTPAPPAATATAAPPAATATAVPPAATNTLAPPAATATAVPPAATSTVALPAATNTPAATVAPPTVAPPPTAPPTVALPPTAPPTVAPPPTALPPTATPTAIGPVPGMPRTGAPDPLPPVLAGTGLVLLLLSAGWALRRRGAPTQ